MREHIVPLSPSFTVAFFPLDKNQNWKFQNHDHARFEKNCSFLPILAPFYQIC